MNPGADPAVASAAIGRLLAVRPQLGAIVLAADAIGLGPRELLHAGPSLIDPRRPVAVLMSSAVMAALQAGWATDEADAEAQVREGAIGFGPAQDRRCVTPLAAVISAGTPLVQIEDANDPSQRFWAPLSAVRGADLRMGRRDAALPARLAQRDDEIAPALQRALSNGPIALLPLAAMGLAAGDDLHSRTTGANAAFAHELRSRGEAELAAHVQATPLFFLTVWMAARALMLRAMEEEGDAASAPAMPARPADETRGRTSDEAPSAQRLDARCIVTRAGGNGERFGIALAGAPPVWSTTPATAPRGHRMPSIPADTPACGAIGDSAVIDLLGFGAQRLSRSPEPLQALGDFAPAGREALADRLLIATHPAFETQRVGLDARRVVDEGAAPLIALAMIAADGCTGFVGRGLYMPPVALFAQALRTLDQARRN